MKSFYRWLQAIAYCGVFLALTGCISSTYVERKEYLLNLHNSHVKKMKIHKYAVMIDSSNVSAPFNQLSFIYRISNTEYLTDYYHTFISPLTQQFDPFLINYSYAVGCFDPIAVNELGNSDYELQPTITQFYADYRDRNHPRAVVALNFKLVKREETKVVGLLNKTFVAQVPIKAKNTQSLLVAWRQGLRRVTAQGIHAMNRIFVQ